MEIQIKKISDFSEPLFQAAFHTYFNELEIAVTDWEGLWEEMNSGENTAYLALENDRAIGFLQFTEIELSNWFFTQKLGFIREFWLMRAIAVRVSARSYWSLQRSTSLKMPFHKRF